MAKRKKSVPIATMPDVFHTDAMRWTSRLEESINRLATATTDLTIGVAEHTKRLDHMEQQSRKQEDGLAKLAEVRERDYRDLTERITQVQTDIAKTIQEHTNTLAKSIGDAQTKIEKKIEEADQQRVDGDRAIFRRVRRLELWRSAIAGGAILGGALFIYFFVKLFWLAWHLPVK